MNIKIKGMHCEACKSLILLELEENGFKDKVKAINLLGNNIGEVVLENITNSEISKIIYIINNLKGYEVIN